MAVYASNMASRGPFASAAPPIAAAHAAPAGTFLPGTKVHVGTHRVIIERYLSEGGFAHVYVVKLPQPIDGNEKAVLKRVAVPDKDQLANMRTEVETMKKLRGQNKYIVKYIDSHASQLKGTGYEVFLLMEFCQGGGLIDFMNTRLQNRLTEPEIIKIFTDVAEGVACMHYLKPALLHRDLKVENVLISTTAGKRIFKLCDFGSSAPPRPAAHTAAEARIIEDDIQKHTTLQYRSPEMVDVYRKLPIDEKSDIWALGCFLYKLCYYTTPFEEVGQMAILNAKYKYPGYPKFSDQMKLLIASMLREKPSDRPNIYQVLQKACQLDKRPLSVRDIYTNRSQSESRKDHVMPDSATSSQVRTGATLAPDSAKKESSNVPQIEPMRRGRPLKPVSAHTSAKPSPSPLRMMDSSDPFAALDKGRRPDDELSSKFPTLDEFSLMTDSGKKFQFEPKQEQRSESLDPALSQRVTNALADEAFVRSPSPPKEKPSIASKSAAVLERTRTAERKVAPITTQAPLPQKSGMISTGTMTSPSSTPPPMRPKPLSDKPVWRVPANEPARSTSIDQRTAPRQPIETKEKSRLSRLLHEDSSRSQGQLPGEEPRSPTSSRPSLENSRPSMKDIDLGLTRSRSLNIRERPASVNIGKGPTHIKDTVIRRRDYEANFVSAEPEQVDTSAVESETNMHSAVDFLKELEEEDKGRKHHKRLSSGSRHGKRSSLPQIAMSGTKLLAGRFGDAFKMFEGGHEHGRRRSQDHDREEDKQPAMLKDRSQVLTPIAGSEATDLSDDRLELFETEDLSPEMRRELEKRQLDAEERRVASAAAAYRQRLAAKGGSSSGGGVQRAATIQNKMHSLLNENARPAQKTASGYGEYTNEQRTPQNACNQRQPPLTKAISNPTPVPPKPAVATAAAANYQAQASLPQRPSAPPKPQVLRTGTGSAPNSALPRDLGQSQANDPMSPDDWEANFNQKYPNLSGIEMVEADLDGGKRPQTRVREV